VEEVVLVTELEEEWGRFDGRRPAIAAVDVTLEVCQLTEGCNVLLEGFNDC
jgi:hypothetical protein